MRACVCTRVSVSVYGPMFVFSLDSFRPGLGQVAVSSESVDVS